MDIVPFISPEKVKWGALDHLSNEDWTMVPSWYKWGLPCTYARWLKKNRIVVVKYIDGSMIAIRKARSVFDWELVSWVDPEVQETLGALLVMQAMAGEKEVDTQSV